MSNLTKLEEIMLKRIAAKLCKQGQPHSGVESYMRAIVLAFDAEFTEELPFVRKKLLYCSLDIAIEEITESGLKNG